MRFCSDTQLVYT